MAKTATIKQPVVHHQWRTFLGALCGLIASLLIAASILVVWANRTLTDTNTYVATVGPVISSPALQDFIATKVTNQLLTSAPTTQLASSLLAPAQITGQTPDELDSLMTPVIHDSVVQILQSPAMQQVWTQTNRTDHAAFIQQLDANDAAITIDLTPIVNGVMTQMEQTKLAPVAKQIQVGSGTTTVQLKGGPLEKVRTYYHLLKTATWVILGLAILFAALSVWASVHHAKTLRRMLVSTGVSSLVTAAVISFSGAVPLPTADPQAAKLAVALVGTLFHGLAIGCLVLGIVCLIGAIASKLYSRSHAPVMA
jgi:hypothetical protein